MAHKNDYIFSWVLHEVSTSKVFQNYLNSLKMSACQSILCQLADKVQPGSYADVQCWPIGYLAMVLSRCWINGQKPKHPVLSACKYKKINTSARKNQLPRIHTCHWRNIADYQDVHSKPRNIAQLPGTPIVKSIRSWKYAVSFFRRKIWIYWEKCAAANR